MIVSFVVVMNTVDVRAGEDQDKPSITFEVDGGTPVESYTLNFVEPTYVPQTLGDKTSDSVKEVRTADLDYDGDLDVVAISYSDDTLSWFKNDGSGEFGSEIIISNSVDGGQQIDIMDIDGDGYDDIVALGYNDLNFYWYKNDGSGNFTSQLIYTATKKNFNAFSLTDIDGDGIIDIVFSQGIQFSHRVFWMKNDGSGVFTIESTMETNNYPKELTTADFDGDGDMDVVAIVVNTFTENDPYIAWYENDGSGTFSSAQVIEASALISSYHVVASDIDNDGDMDILSAGKGANGIVWFVNDGSGTFTREASLLSLEETDVNASFEVLDYDQDGDMDIIASNFFSNVVYLSNQGDATFEQSVYQNVTINDIAFGDFNDDGNRDFVTSSYHDVKVYDNQGDGYFQLVEPIEPTKENHRFDGWYVDQAMTELFDFNTSITDDLTLYAKFSPLSTTITFDTDGGTSVDDIVMLPGEAVSAPADPTKEGYTFDGWYSDQAFMNAYTFTNMPSEDITLYAKFNINSYDIIFKDYDDTTIDTLAFDYQADLSSVTLPSDPQREGYTFNGWDMILPSNMPSNDIVVTATYTINSYDIVFKDYDDTTIEAMAFDYDDDLSGITIPSDPQREGYTFNGWDVVIPDNMPSNDIIITATYTKEQVVDEDALLNDVDGLQVVIEDNDLENLDVDITLNVEVIAIEDTDEEETKLLEDKIKEEIGRRNDFFEIDISLLYTQGNVENLVTETSTPITITITIPDEYVGSDSYHILRLHNGVVDVLETTYDSENNTLTFETDRFSTYVVAYEINGCPWCWLLLLLLIPIGYVIYQNRDEIRDKKDKVVKKIQDKKNKQKNE